jgi:tRNA(fMet)-specific endonuclease VapC
MRKILLDTNAYAALANGNKEILAELSSADIVYLSVFVLGELFAGFKGGNQERKNREMLERFGRKPTVKILSATFDTAETFACVKDSLRKAGTPIPLNDVWIAAHALESGSVLVTLDQHFQVVPGLRLWK